MKEEPTGNFFVKTLSKTPQSENEFMEPIGLMVLEWRDLSGNERPQSAYLKLECVGRV